MARTRAGLEKAIGQIRELRLDFWQNVRILGSGERSIDLSRNRPRRRFLRIGRIDVSGRARPRRILRRPFPRRTSMHRMEKLSIAIRIFRLRSRLGIRGAGRPRR